MRASPVGVAFIKSWERCRLQAYDDNGSAAGGVYTIGWGTTRYPDGTRVQQGDVCTQLEADAYFQHDLRRFERGADDLTRDDLAPRQFDAVVALCYQSGEGLFRRSTLRRMINTSPNDPAIRSEWVSLKWCYSGGRPMRGLWRRRHAEADLYFGVGTPVPPFPA